MNKKRVSFILLLLTFSIVDVSQGQEVYKFWIKLHDKVGCAFSIDNPSAYLSQRALERRQHQRIAIDSLDLPLSETYLRAFRQAGFIIQNQSKWLNGVTLFSPDSMMVYALDTMSFVDTVIFCERSTIEAPNIVAVGPGLAYLPMAYDSIYDSNYYLHSYPPIAQLNGIDLHRNGFEGQGLIIGVCDGGYPGVDSIVYFKAMRDEGRLLATRDFVWSGNQVFSIHGHGTKVLSLMASYLPGYFVGTAPKASYVLCRTENTERETILEEYNWIAAAEYLDSIGADIITTSLGYFTFDDSLQNHTLSDLDGNTTPITIAADIAVSRGMLVLNAAGNNGEEGNGRLNAPADAKQVLTVGAVTIEKEWAQFSSFGPTADMRVKPDVMAMGAEVYGATAEGNLSMASGTSLATPIMAGMMACLWQRYPNLTPSQLCDSVRAWGSLADHVDMHSGYGIPDFSRAFSADSVQGVDIQQMTGAPLLFKLSPNPCWKSVWVELPTGFSSSGAVLIIRDLMGRLIKEIPISTTRFAVPLDGMPPGTYYVTVIAPAGSSTQKLVVR